MKLKTSFIALVVLLVLLSCNSNDDNIQTNNPYVGNWEIVEIRMSVAQDNNLDGIFSNNLVDELDCIQFYFELREDFTCTRAYTTLAIGQKEGDQYEYDCSGFSILEGTYSITDDGIDFNFRTEPDLLFEGNNLVLNPGQETPVFEKFVYSKID